MSHFNAKQVLLDQLEKDTTLTPFQKKAIRVTLVFRPAKAQEVLGETTFAAIMADIVKEDGVSFAVADPSKIDWSTIDWAKLFQFIMQIIALFNKS